VLQIERGGALLILYFLKQIAGCGAYGVGALGGVANGVGTHGHCRRSEGGVVAGTVAVE
jgi:hypothetical protein